MNFYQKVLTPYQASFYLDQLIIISIFLKKGSSFNSVFTVVVQKLFSRIDVSSSEETNMRPVIDQDKLWKAVWTASRVV